MAARKRKTTLTDTWRLKIKASMIANRLYEHLLGKVELSPTQVKAAQLLFSKLEPDLARTELASDPENPLDMNWTVTVVKAK